MLTQHTISSEGGHGNQRRHRRGSGEVNELFAHYFPVLSQEEPAEQQPADETAEVRMRKCLA